MRYFHLLGQFNGEHPIYESREEFAKDFPDTKPYKWNRDEKWAELYAGDWIEATDGYIIQCLRVHDYNGNRMVRVPMGTFRLSMNPKAKVKPKLYAQFANQDLYSLSGKPPHRRNASIKPRKVQFAHFINLGFTPIEAYKKANGGDFLRNSTSVNFQIIDWLTDEAVMEIIKADSDTNFLERIQQDEELSDDVLTEYVKDFMRHVRKGSQTHLNSIGPLLVLLGKTPAAMNPNGGKKVKEATEVPYNSVPPPNELAQ